MHRRHRLAGPAARCQSASARWRREVTAFAVPCNTIREVFADQRQVRISQKVHPGWSRVYVRVVEEGVLAVGDPVDLRDR